jgi:hypothetical protein
MLTKTLGAALIALALPTFALAYCDDMRRKPDGALCPEGQIYDAEFAVCVHMPTG